MECTSLCTAATASSDCSGTLAKCDPVSFTRPGGGTQAATVCGP
jgi:hypothetical protein